MHEQVQLFLNELTKSCRTLGRIELHHEQGHASNAELEQARVVVFDARRDFLKAAGLQHA